MGGTILSISHRLVTVFGGASEDRDSGADAGIDVVLEADEGVERALRLFVVGHCGGDEGWMLAVLALGLTGRASRAAGDPRGDGGWGETMRGGGDGEMAAQRRFEARASIDPAN